MGGRRVVMISVIPAGLGCGRPPGVRLSTIVPESMERGERLGYNEPAGLSSEAYARHAQMQWFYPAA